MNFRSDNNAEIAPEIMTAIAEEAGRDDDSYGRDATTARLDALWSEVFETRVQVLPLVSGTAANALALSFLSPPHGRVFCHAEAHIVTEEVNAPGFFQPGLAISAVEGAQGRISLDALKSALDGAAWGAINASQPAVLSLTQATEWGTVYDLDHLEALAKAAKARGLAVHMDGARLANAIAALGCTPAEATWRRGVDVLSLGATKNGCMMAEAVVVFGERPIRPLWYKAKQAGQVAAKLRFVSAQLLAYGRDGLWLELARRANAAARKLAGELARIPGVTLVAKAEANMVFVRLPPAIVEALRRRGFQFHLWDGRGTARLVTSFRTSDAAIAGLVTAIRACQNEAAE